MKVSEITVADIANYLKLSTDDYTTTEINAFLSAAKAFIRSYTGLDDTKIDTHEDMVVVAYVLIQDMFDNRSMYVDKTNLNHVVQTILGMYATNLLPTPDEDVVVV